MGDAYSMNRTGERGDPCGSPDPKGAGGSFCLSMCMLIVRLSKEALGCRDEILGHFEVFHDFDEAFVLDAVEGAFDVICLDGWSRGAC